MTGPGFGAPPWVDAPWWEVYGAHLRAEKLTRGEWIEALAQAWCLVRIPESLTPRQLDRQEDMIERLMRRRFYPTTVGNLPGLVALPGHRREECPAMSSADLAVGKPHPCSQGRVELIADGQLLYRPPAPAPWGGPARNDGWRGGRG